MPTLTPISAQALTELLAEIADLESRGRAEIGAKLKDAASDGDLKENAEYLACREAQSHLETRIEKLRIQARNCTVVEEGEGEAGVVRFGATVTYKDEASGMSKTLRIVSSRQANPAEGTLSAEAPIARALDGHRKGDVVVVQTPKGARRLQVKKVD